MLNPDSHGIHKHPSYQGGRSAFVQRSEPLLPNRLPETVQRPGKLARRSSLQPDLECVKTAISGNRWFSVMMNSGVVVVMGSDDMKERSYGCPTCDI